MSSETEVVNATRSKREPDFDAATVMAGARGVPGHPRVPGGDGERVSRGRLRVDRPGQPAELPDDYGRVAGAGRRGLFAAAGPDAEDRPVYPAARRAHARRP